MNYVACIAEGAAETAIIDILLDHHLLIFDREEMLDEQVLRCRSASVFESRYLRKGFSGKITVYRILDSRREKFSTGFYPASNWLKAPSISVTLPAKNRKIKSIPHIVSKRIS